MRLLVVTIILAFLAGCETFGSKIDEQKLQSIDKVALVSLIDDQISYNYVGLTVFNNKDNLYSFSGLKIDEYIQSKLSVSLERANPRVKVYPVTVDFDEYRSSYENPKHIASLNVDKFISKFSKVADQRGFRYVIVASRDSIQFDQTPVGVNGVGLRKKIGNSTIGSFVLIKFQLLDLKTSEVLAKARVFERHRESKFPWLEPFEKNSEEFKESFKKYIYSSIDEWSKSVSAILIQSRKDYQICSERVYKDGFYANGVTYKSRDQVVEAIGKYQRQKIMEEGVDPKESKPPYISKFEEMDERILDCIGDL